MGFAQNVRDKSAELAGLVRKQGGARDKDDVVGDRRDAAEKKERPLADASVGGERRKDCGPPARGRFRGKGFAEGDGALRETRLEFKKRNGLPVELPDPLVIHEGVDAGPDQVDVERQVFVGIEIGAGADGAVRAAVEDETGRPLRVRFRFRIAPRDPFPVEPRRPPDEVERGIPPASAQKPPPGGPRKQITNDPAKELPPVPAAERLEEPAWGASAHGLDLPPRRMKTCRKASSIRRSGLVILQDMDASIARIRS